MSRKKGAAGAPGVGLVLDCSIVMAWHFADEADAYADRVARGLPLATLDDRLRAAAIAAGAEPFGLA